MSAPPPVFEWHVLAEAVVSRCCQEIKTAKITFVTLLNISWSIVHGMGAIYCLITTAGSHIRQKLSSVTKIYFSLPVK